ncbi:hypothetical protein [Cyclobacterium salsum]|uniref:hypothetical protein n=1 Tax=Cyclobacterium salsum TaxID=2666329 RepID=UPI0013917BA9|nr:hypothetical protein [Cyclobacterium salsum]
MGLYNWVQSIKEKILKEIKVLKGEKGKNKVFSSKNEFVNNEGDQAAGRDWINTLMAGGGWLGFQKLQWKNLTEYLVHLTEKERVQK